MYRLARASFPVVAAVVGAMLLTACFGDDTDPSTATPRPASTATVPSPPPASTPATVPPAEVHGDEFIYSTEAGSVMQGTRTWPTRAVIAFDPASDVRETLFEYGGVDDYPIGELLSGEAIFYATENRIVVVEPDGSSPRELFTATSQFAIRDFDVSPDGSTIALTVLESQVFPFHSQLVFVDIPSGEETSRIDDAHEAFDSFSGYFSVVRWRPDGESLIVGGATASEIPGGVATVTLDGNATVHTLQGYPLVSLDGGRAVGGPFARCIAGPSSITIALEVRDLESGEVVERLAEPETGYSAYAWSPDASELLYRSQPFDESGACNPTGPWYLLGEEGPSEVADLDDVFMRWFGDERVALVCDVADGRPEAVLFNRSMEQRKACGSGPEAQGELRFNGMPVERLFEVRVLGFR